MSWDWNTHITTSTRTKDYEHLQLVSLLSPFTWICVARAVLSSQNKSFIAPRTVTRLNLLSENIFTRRKPNETMARGKIYDMDGT